MSEKPTPGDRIVGLQLSAAGVLLLGLNTTGLSDGLALHLAVVLFLALECIRRSLKQITDALIGNREKT